MRPHLKTHNNTFDENAQWRKDNQFYQEQEYWPAVYGIRAHLKIHSALQWRISRHM